MLLPLCPTQILPQSISTLCLKWSRDLRRCKERKLNYENLYYLLVQKVAKLTCIILRSTCACFETLISSLCQSETVNTDKNRVMCFKTRLWESITKATTARVWWGFSFSLVSANSHICGCNISADKYIFILVTGVLSKNAPINPPGTRRSHNGKTDGSATLQPLTRFNCHNCSFVAAALAVCHRALNTHFELSYPI